MFTFYVWLVNSNDCEVHALTQTWLQVPFSKNIWFILDVKHSLNTDIAFYGSLLTCITKRSSQGLPGQHCRLCRLVTRLCSDVSRRVRHENTSLHWDKAQYRIYFFCFRLLIVTSLYKNIYFCIISIYIGCSVNI